MPGAAALHDDPATFTLSPPGGAADAFAQLPASTGSDQLGETPFSGPPSAAGVPMQEMIEAIGASVRIAAREGAALARIELRPADLGHIVIRLTQSGEGLRARVTAETPAAAQALAQGRSELTQLLGSLKVSLLGLDIGFSDQLASGQDRAGLAAGARGGAGLPREGAGEPEEATGEPQDAARSTVGALGEIVDVFA